MRLPNERLSLSPKRPTLTFFLLSKPIKSQIMAANKLRQEMQTFKRLILSGCMSLTAGCSINSSESFTFKGDLPPGFSYYASAMYSPAKGETCTVMPRDRPDLGFNRKWRTEYKPESSIPLYRTVKGCRLSLFKVDLEINAMYGEEYGQFSSDTTAIYVREELEERYKGSFNSHGESSINGQCQWSFRTVGPKRYIIKLLGCSKVDVQGVAAKGHPVGAYTLDQLPGKTVTLKLTLAKDEKPGWGDNWVKFPNGWKRCLGEGIQDQHGYCRGNYKDFSSFKMPDDRDCTIYPTCTE